MKKFIDILPEKELVEIIGQKDRLVRDLELDSRKIAEGYCFIALKGLQFDGHNFIPSAIEKGAKCIICEVIPEETKDDVSYAKLKDVQSLLPEICKEFYGNPSKDLNLIGVTGTNGKTTIVNLLFDLFEKLGIKSGMLSTIENKIAGKVFQASHTTPDIISLYRLLNLMVLEECEYAFMEVSSHAIHQNRVGGLEFKAGVFTNISHDHLDYHKTFKEYIKTKKKFFDNLATNSFALTNVDDKNGEVMVQNTKAKIKKYGLKKMCDYKGKILHNSLEGLQMTINETEIYCRLIGQFNAYNLLATYGIAVEMGMDEMDVLVNLSKLQAPEGRFQWIRNDKGVFGIVDYAHTPDALEKILKTLNEIRGKQNQLITVVGCGGDRDRAKRPKMAQVSSILSSRVIFTSDNPRSEDPKEILKEMKEGMKSIKIDNSISIENREEAIKTAVFMAGKGDIILVAGKGHEKYQEIKGKKFPFDDKEKLSKYLLKELQD